MTQIEFIAEAGDLDVIVEGCLRLDLQLVPSLRYLSASHFSIGSSNEFNLYRTETTLFFLRHDDFARSPLNLVQIQGGENRGKYVIQQRKGGPTITFMTGRPVERDAARWLSSGFISYYPTYDNTVTHVREEPPSLLISKFKSIEQLIVKGSHLVDFECIGGGYRGFWLMPQAYQSLRRGAKLAMTTFEGLDVRGLDEFPNALQEKRRLNS